MSPSPSLPSPPSPTGSLDVPDGVPSTSASSSAPVSSPEGLLSGSSDTQEYRSCQETPDDRHLKSAESKSSSWSSSPLSVFYSFDRSKTQRGQEEKLGLPNIGNSCFLNSALQCLYSLPSFCGDIARQEALWSPQSTSLKLLRYLGELYKSRQGQSSYKGKRKLLRSIKRSMAELNDEYEDYSEQDAHEFLLLLFMKMKMEGETLQGTSTSPSYICPVQNFEFRLQCVRTCSSCGDKVIQEEEVHNNLSLDLHPLLITGLKSFFKPSELECTCRQCSGHQATVVRHFLTLPRVLVLHVKRYHNDGAQLRKVTDAVGIPPLLSLASLVGEQGDAAGMDTEDHSNQTTYRLSGIISHLGESIDTGHYISDIVGENGTGWLTLNDSHVTKTAEATVLKTREETAYILFYVLW
ncbi:Ubiquitin carboxyl-terminal hydrolase 37 [Merluccius polli]|uniref:Ubiquitin carboxyl-terminal hydrolase n=1 Tax=Merluccius polli TaxID=89951 RepID=A0AA47P912_MERPO|nr:Ubiquitin carboxyl-terminal hydrolase 37 [Merluccius polli]